MCFTDNSTPADELAVSLAKEYGVKVRAFKMPAEDSSAITRTVELVTKEMGEIDIVVANAGICIHRDAGEMSDSESCARNEATEWMLMICECVEEFEDVFKVNTFSPFYLARAGMSISNPDGAVLLLTSHLLHSIPILVP
jgi:sorbose reductase